MILENVWIIPTPYSIVLKINLKSYSICRILVASKYTHWYTSSCINKYSCNKKRTKEREKEKSLQMYIGVNGFLAPSQTQRKKAAWKNMHLFLQAWHRTAYRWPTLTTKKHKDDLSDWNCVRACHKMMPKNNVHNQTVACSILDKKVKSWVPLNSNLVAS
jgi:hypothetical protein